MNVIRKAKKRYAARRWVRAHEHVFKKLIYDRDDLNLALSVLAGYKERQRKIWRDISKMRRKIKR